MQQIEQTRLACAVWTNHPQVGRDRQPILKPRAQHEVADQSEVLGREFDVLGDASRDLREDLCSTAA
jgi:hypothetical protein